MLSSHLASHDSAQAAFVESMILLFASGKTGLSAAVTGAYIGICPPAHLFRPQALTTKKLCARLRQNLTIKDMKRCPTQFQKAECYDTYWGFV